MKELPPADIEAAKAFATAAINQSSAENTICLAWQRPKLIEILEKVYDEVPIDEVRRAIDIIKNDNARQVVPKRRDVA